MKKYSVIYADPPWSIKAGRPLGGYEMKDGKQLFLDGGTGTTKSRDTEYPSMTIEEIKWLDVKSIAADNSCLFIWVTNQHLPDVFGVINSWGFKYSTTLVWCKNMMGGGLGGTFRINTEFLIFATKGKIKAKKSIKGTWFNIKRKYVNGAPRHSLKPDFFHEMISELFDGDKLEMFARDKKDGWDTWGNELENDTNINNIKQTT